MKMKNCLALCLALALVLALVPGVALAEDAIWEINGTTYPSLTKAMEAVTSGTQVTIKLLDDATGDGVKVGENIAQNVIFDLNDFSYTIAGTVGSAGTETNGFQLLKGSTVAFKNGTIYAGASEILLQNYADLTLDNVTLDARNTSCQYVSSNNNGSLNITGDTNIYAAAGQKAFDVYYWSASYPDGVTVNVNTTGTISGIIEYDSDLSGKDKIAENATLNITSGNFEGSFSVKKSDANGDTGITISGGTFKTADGSANTDVTKYLAANMTQNENGEVIIDETSEKVVAKIGNTPYESLQAALEKATSGDTVVLLKNADLGNNTIDSDVTLQVSSSATLTVAEANLQTLMGSQGTIQVQSGGGIKVGDETLIGTSGNIDLTEGYVDISVDGTFPSCSLKLDFTGAAATIPAGKRFVTQKTITQGQQELNIPINVTLDAGTTLTVNGTGTGNPPDALRIANGSTFTNNGTIVVNSGAMMRVGAEGTVDGSGTITNNGTITLHKNDAGNATVSSITLTSTGVVYSEFDASGIVGPEANVTAETGNYTLENVTSGTSAVAVNFTHRYSYRAASTSTTTGGGSTGGGSTTHSITTPSGLAGGTVSVSPAWASSGATVTITALPEAGYGLASLNAWDANGNALLLTKVSDTQYTFTMPNSSVHIDAAFASLIFLSPPKTGGAVSQTLVLCLLALGAAGAVTALRRRSR